MTQNGELFAEPDRMFTTQGASAGAVLPDGRGWELVSPANNQGALIEPFGTSNGSGVGLVVDSIQAASDGSAITYLASGVVGEEARGKTGYSQTLSARAPGGGWGSRDLSLPRGVVSPE